MVSLSNTLLEFSGKCLLCFNYEVFMVLNVLHNLSSYITTDIPACSLRSYSLSFLLVLLFFTVCLSSHANKILIILFAAVQLTKCIFLYLTDQKLIVSDALSKICGSYSAIHEILNLLTGIWHNDQANKISLLSFLKRNKEGFYIESDQYIIVLISSTLILFMLLNVPGAVKKSIIFSMGFIYVSCNFQESREFNFLRFAISMVAIFLVTAIDSLLWVSTVLSMSMFFSFIIFCIVISAKADMLVLSYFLCDLIRYSMKNDSNIKNDPEFIGFVQCYVVCFISTVLFYLALKGLTDRRRKNLV